MNTNLLPISQYVQQCGVDIKITSMAAGLAVSRHLDIPTSEVESINMHFVSQVEDTMNQFLSTINEDVILDFEVAVKTARAAYMLRYWAAHPKSEGSVIMPGCGGFFDRMFGVSAYFDDSTCCYCQDNADAIIALTNRFLAVLPSLVKH